ncbi:MAG: 4'-phosphopantetheinyl transferase family protein [Coprococcus phoceensis]
MTHLGCDIEGVKQVRLDVARRFFVRPNFKESVEQNTEVERAEGFYRYWVLKESFMKATRLGMKLGLDQFEIAIFERGKSVPAKTAGRVSSEILF